MREYFKQQLAGKKVLISGGTGFIGKNILLYFKDNNLMPDQVTIITRNKLLFLNTYPEFGHLPYLDFIETNIYNLEYKNQEYDYVIHGATTVVEKIEPKQLLDEIIGGAKSMLEFALKAGAKSVINLSSGAVYGELNSCTPVTENTLCRPLVEHSASSYGLGKIVAEHYGYLYASEMMKVTSLRCFAFGGRYLDHIHYALGDFIWQAMQGKDIKVKAGSGIYRSYLATEDLVESILYTMLTSVSRASNYEVYNVGSDQAIRIVDLVKYIVTTLNSSSKINYLNLADQKISYYVPNINKIRNIGLKMASNLDDIIKTISGDYVTRKNSGGIM